MRNNESDVLESRIELIMKYLFLFIAANLVACSPPCSEYKLDTSDSVWSTTNYCRSGSKIQKIDNELYCVCPEKK